MPDFDDDVRHKWLGDDDSVPQHTLCKGFIKSFSVRVDQNSYLRGNKYDALLPAPQETTMEMHIGTHTAFGAEAIKLLREGMVEIIIRRVK
jgi:hypothetical protein